MQSQIYSETSNLGELPLTWKIARIPQFKHERMENLRQCLFLAQQEKKEKK